ncbi:hypothetical protein N7471_011363 [Penicillium samsonianum]|uniref:uncharacterized protein n=1 Tax=Penicillium samsonianum TaxID=1882272 RepID=UPI002548DBB3|nr:uncharacterized protein N7471_011363 [Penicillium samsonianum]KAJ6124046.1 hypothetical protein N7471_011363 [Penicillium samsonianum]
MNPKLTTLELEMAVGLDIKMPVGSSGWRTIKKGWVMNIKSCLPRLLATCTEESYLRRAQHSTGLGEGIGSSDEAHRIKLKQQMEDDTQCVATELTDLADRYTEPTLHYLQRAFNY